MSTPSATSLIGRVAARVIVSEIGVPEPGAGFAKLVMHQLTAEDMLAIARTAYEDPDLNGRLEIALPRHYFADLGGLPEGLFSTEPITELRCRRCSKSARLMALVDDSQAQSLSNVSKIGRDSLLRKELAGVWLDEAIRIEDSSLPNEGLIVLTAAFAGLFGTDRATLRSCAQFFLEVVKQAKTKPALQALGASLWRLRMPNLGDVFYSVKNHRPSDFQKAFLKHARNGCYLLKRGPNQAPFTRQLLEGMLSETGPDLLPEVREAVVAFIDSDDGWTEASERLARMEWSEVRKFFEGSPKARTQTLGERTEEVFKLLDSERFDPSDWVYVKDLKVRGSNAQRTDADADFYQQHISDIQEDPGLAAAWERFVFGGETFCNDFRVGLLECAHRLRKERDSIDGEAVLEVVALESEKIKLRRKNPIACRYFEARYGSLQKGLGDAARFRKCEVFQYSSFEAESKDSDKIRGSTGKKANQLSFRIRLASKTNDESRSTEIRLTWEFLPESVINGYPGDLSRLIKYANYHKKAPLISSLLDINPKNARSAQSTFSLADVSAVQSPKRTESGALVPTAMSTACLSDDWSAALASAQDSGFIGEPLAKLLSSMFAEFSESYWNAVKALRASELDSSEIDHQAESWAVLLSIISKEIKAESHRALLLRPLLRVGLTCIQNPELAAQVAIVCPWHPLRLQSIKAAGARFSRLIAQLVKDDGLVFSDRSGELFLRDSRLDLGTAGLPEVGFVWRGEDTVLLAQSDELGDYSLLEPPISSPQGGSGTNENPARMAEQISAIVGTFLELHPHESDNLSIVLYDCDSKLLPTAVVEAISSSDEDSARDTTCQVILTHQERPVLADLYESIASQEGDDDAFYVSESSRDFMSRVRINISVDQGVRQQPDGAHLTDIVFCQDVISRRADPSREPVPRSCTCLPEKLIIHHWSKKRQLVVGDNSSVVYLTCPAQTNAGWSYLHALAILKERDYAERVWLDESCLIPARRLNFDKPETRQIFEATHALGNWVVNFDELLDRRMLRRRDVKVIRYRQSASGGRSLTISSNAKDTLLRGTLIQKLSPLLSATLSQASLNEVATRFINQANDISGNLVLRAARRGANANELIGLVLSHHLIRCEFAPNQTLLCFLLDDYAEWLGQTEERIADLVILVPTDGPDGKCLDIVVTEAKFVRFEQAGPAATKSGRQLRDSLELLERALLGQTACIDQELWLARISDLLLEGIQNLGQNIDIPGWRSAIRDHNFKLSVRGQSHVFIHSPLEAESERSRFTGVKGCNGQQEVFSRKDVRAIVAGFLGDAAPEATAALRLALSGIPPGARTYRAVPVLKPNEPDQGPPPEDSGGTRDGPEKPPVIPPASSSGGSPLPTDSVDAAQPNSPSALLPIAQESAGPAVDSSLEEAWIAKTTQEVRHALLKRELSAEIVRAKGTPNALLLQFKGSDRLTVNLLESKIAELRTTDGIDIISVRPGLGTVVVMVARPDRKTLSLSETWRHWNPASSTGNTEILIAARESDNEPLFLSPYPQPHTLVAGTTGSGKSVLIQNIILGIAATNTPEQAEIVIIDPKQGLDYLGFEKLPHLTESIITESSDAIAKLTALVDQMESRYKQFREHRVQNIDDYLKKEIGTLPRIWVIHDEFGDWTQTKEYSDQVGGLVNRLGQKARAAGIYLIFAAQRPDNTIFPMVLRSNLANRLVLKVDSAGTSEIATGIKNAGAERLLGRGHLLAILGNLAEPTYAQVPFVNAEEIEKIVEAINRKYPR